MQNSNVCHFFKVHDKASRGIVRDPVIINHKPLLNGDFEFLGRQYRSSSEVSDFSCVSRIQEPCFSPLTVVGVLKTGRGVWFKGAVSRYLVYF